MSTHPRYVLGQSNGESASAAPATFKNFSIVMSRQTHKLPNGIVQLSIMQPDGKLLSERLVFNQSQPLLNIGVKTDKTTYAKKESVRLTLQVPVTDSLKSNYSVSVIDDAKVPYNDDQELGILSNYLLTSDLKGYVEQPNYYFNEKNENRKEALNALLMT